MAWAFASHFARLRFKPMFFFFAFLNADWSADEKVRDTCDDVAAVHSSDDMAASIFYSLKLARDSSFNIHMYWPPRTNIW